MPFFPVIFSEGIEKVFHLDSFQILKCRSKKYYAFRECYLHIIINWSLLPNNISCSSIERDAHSFVCYHELSLDVRHFVCNSLWVFKIISNNEIGCLVRFDIKKWSPVNRLTPSCMWASEFFDNIQSYHFVNTELYCYGKSTKILKEIGKSATFLLWNHFSSTLFNIFFS